VAADATKQQTAAERDVRIVARTGAEPTPVSKTTQAGLENPPTIAAGAAGLVGALVLWLVTETDAPAYVDVAITTFGVAVGAFLGRLAQKFTYDRATMDQSVANFVDDLHAIGGTPQAEHADVDPDVPPDLRAR